MRRMLSRAALVALSLGWALPSASLAAPAAAKAARYQFEVVEVSGGIDEATKDVAKQLLTDELSSRPEFVQAANDVAPGSGVRRFAVSLKVDAFKKDLKDPRPGGRLKQLAVASKLSVFGAELPTQKLAFSGEGEAMTQAEIVERRLEEETKPLVKEVLERALKEAVDQAVAKLSAPKYGPVNESKRKKPRK